MATSRRKIWNSLYGHGVQFVTPNYLIDSWARDPNVLEGIPVLLEAALPQYRKLTRLPGPRRLPLYYVVILANREHFVHFTKETGEDCLLPEGWEYKLTAYASGRGNQGCILFDDGSPVTLFRIAHEGMHQFCRRQISKYPIPRWLDEGLAVMAEGFICDAGKFVFDSSWGYVRIQELRAALRQDYWIGLADVVSAYRKSKPPYHQLWAMMHFIASCPALEQGRLRLIADAAAERITRPSPEEGERWSLELFRHYISDDLQAFEQDYRRFAEALAQQRLKGEA